MSLISSELKAHYASDCTTLARIWTVILLNGTVHRFTDHDQNIAYAGHVYTASNGFNASNAAISSGLNVDNLSVTGFLLTPVIDKDQILSGMWDHARVKIIEVNWADLSMGERYIQSGRLGQVDFGKGLFTVELRGLAQDLQRTIGELTSLGCRYELGDSRCKQPLGDYTAGGATVLSVVNAQHAFISDLPTFGLRLTPISVGPPPNDYFQAGRLTWLTGANAGLKIAEVDNYTASSGQIVLARDVYYPIKAGDTFDVATGCNHLLKTGVHLYLGDCKVKFGNVVNFGGEPEMVGEKIRRIGGA